MQKAFGNWTDKGQILDNYAWKQTKCGIVFGNVMQNSANKSSCSIVHGTEIPEGKICNNDWLLQKALGVKRRQPTGEQEKYQDASEKKWTT